MAHAEICPVCEGKGKVKKKPCHGCSGLGWVTVQDEQSYPVPYYPYYPQYPMYPYWPYWSVPSIWEQDPWPLDFGSTELSDGTGYIVPETQEWVYT